MKNVIIIISGLLLWSMSTIAQTGNEIDKNSNLKDRIYTGANFGFSIGNTVTSLEIAPILGYRITNNLTAGTGFSYRYLKYKFTNAELTSSVFGTNLFTRYNVFESYFAQIEYEALRYDQFNAVLDKRRASYSSLLVGGGYSEGLGGNAALNFTILYNMSYSITNSGPYDSPWIIRGGITFGI